MGLWQPVPGLRAEDYNLNVAVPYELPLCIKASLECSGSLSIPTMPDDLASTTIVDQKVVPHPRSPLFSRSSQRLQHIA